MQYHLTPCFPIKMAVRQFKSIVVCKIQVCHACVSKIISKLETWLKKVYYGTGISKETSNTASLVKTVSLGCERQHWTSIFFTMYL